MYAYILSPMEVKHSISMQRDRALRSQKDSIIRPDISQLNVGPFSIVILPTS